MGGALKHFDVSLDIGEIDFGEMRATRQITARRRHFVFARQNVADKSFINERRIFPIERLDGERSERTFRYDFVIHGDNTKNRLINVNVQSLGQSLANNVSIGARIDHGVDGDGNSRRDVGDADGDDGPYNLVFCVDGERRRSSS